MKNIKENHPDGSSYSASLVLKIAAVNPKVLAVIAYSPENISAIKNVSKNIRSLTKPVYTTSSRKRPTVLRNS